ncbi:MAG: NADH-quinone oxidoreductase subunit I [Firmicutes bacterium]|nr:NADH-quinone oxidoreductase subunit I [Bacillota bacterium]
MAYGRGALRGLRVTFRNMFRRPITVRYPFEKLKFAPGFRGGFRFDRDRCIACSQCANACPNNVITVKAQRGEDKKLHLTGYEMDLQYCLFCGYCVEVCPTNCITMTDQVALVATDRSSLWVEFDKGELPDPAKHGAHAAVNPLRAATGAKPQGPVGNVQPVQPPHAAPAAGGQAAQPGHREGEQA